MSITSKYSSIQGACELNKFCNVREGVGSGVGSWFNDNLRRVVGNGGSTFFWTDNWLGGVPLKTQFSRLYDLSVNKECSMADMMRWG